MNHTRFMHRLAMGLAAVLCCVLTALSAFAADSELAPYAEDGDMD